MSNSQLLNVDSLILDPFVSKFHLIRDIGKSPLQTLFLSCTRAFGEDEMKNLLTSYCIKKLENISNINDNESTSTLRTSLSRNHEQFNPQNPALLHILPTTILSKCFSYLDINTLLCSVELVSRDWFHISRLASSITEFPATAIIPSHQQSFKLKRLSHATTLNYKHNAMTDYDNQIDLKQNINELKRINRLYVNGVLPKLINECKDSFIDQLNTIEISYSSKGIDAIFWKRLTNKCNNLRVIRLKNIIIDKQAYQPLIKFIHSLKHLNEFQCHRWRFQNANMTINNIIKALSEHCRLLKELKIEYCRINDKVIKYITKLMEYKLNTLWIINCNRLKMTTLNELGQKQEQLLLSSKYHRSKRLTQFKIDDKMISCAIFDHFCGLKSLSISADHLSGNISYSMLNKFQSLQYVTIQFRSSIDRLSSHSSSQFDWKLFFEELGKTLIYFECNCQINKSKNKINDISNLKLLSKEDYTNFMVLDFNIFMYITTYCQKLKILKMCGWKFDTIKAKNYFMSDATSDDDIKEIIPNDDMDIATNNNSKQIRRSGRSNSMHFLGYHKSKHNKSNTLLRPSTTRYSKFANVNIRSRGNTAKRYDNYNENVNETQSILTLENLIMIPISNLLQTQQQSFINNRNDKFLDYMKLEWMFDFGDIPSLTTLNFWCDTVLGLNCTMSMNEELKVGSVLVLEWNQNWMSKYFRPTIIHHQSKNNSNNNISNTKQRLRKMRKQKQNGINR